MLHDPWISIQRVVPLCPQPLCILGPAIFNDFHYIMFIFNIFNTISLTSLTVSAENCTPGRKIIPSWVSGMRVQTNPNIPMMAPDCWRCRHIYILEFVKLYHDCCNKYSQLPMMVYCFLWWACVNVKLTTPLFQTLNNKLQIALCPLSGHQLKSNHKFLYIATFNI